MNPEEQIISFLGSLDVWLLAKIFVLLVLFLYIGFTLIVIREVDLMNKTLSGVFNFPIKVASRIHLILAIAIFILALMVL